MIDNFRIWVSGEIVWSDGEASEITTLEHECSNEGETCSDGEGYALSNFPLSGVALGHVKVATSPDGIATNALSVTTTITPTNSTTGTVTAGCAIAGASAVDCKFRTVLVGGDAAEMEPFESIPFQRQDTQFWSSAQVDTSPTTSELHREMACGLRSFNLQSVFTFDSFGGFRIGANSVDCGFNGVGRTITTPAGWDYLGFMHHGFLISDGTYPVPGPDVFETWFILDGNKLLW